MQNTHPAPLAGEKKKSHPALRILAAAGALLIIALLLLIYNALCGNFISGMYYKGMVDRYIASTYPGREYSVSDYQYNFKDGSYWFDITDPNSRDGCFSAYYSDYDGRVVDTYENVVNFTNTVNRLEDGFRSEVDPIIDQYLDTKEHIKDGDFVAGEFGYATCRIDEGFYAPEPDTAYLRDKLYLDMPLDAKNMPLPTKIYLNLRGTKEEAFRRAREIALAIQKSGYRIDYYDFTTDDLVGDNNIAYEMIPAGVFFAADSTDEFADYLVHYYSNPDLAPSTTHATFSTQATTASDNH